MTLFYIIYCENISVKINYKVTIGYECLFSDYQ